MSGPTRAGVRKQLAAMVGAFQPGVQDVSSQAISPLMARSALGYGMDPALGAALPRDAAAFLSQLGPNMPLTPTGIDPAGPGGRPLPRITQYPVSENLSLTPGQYKMVPFATMRRMADMSTIARACIGIIQQECADVEYEVAPKEEERGEFKVFPDKKAGLFDQWRSQRKALEAFVARPDPIRGLKYDTWIRMAIEEMLVTDALSIFEHTAWGGAGYGVAGSDLFALEILDGAYIKPLRDIRGGPPAPPNAAYQQIIWGLPRVDLMSLLLDAREDPAVQDAQRGFSYSQAEYMEFTADQLAYLPYYQRSWTLYGLSNIEQAIMFINLALKRLQTHIGYFTDGDVPALLIHVPDTWPLEQITKYEQQWHAKIAGDAGWKNRVNMIPGVQAAEQLKPPQFDMGFDEYVDTVICAAMNVDRTEVGFEPHAGLGGTGYLEGVDDRRKRLTVGPRLREIKGYLDDVFSRRMELPTLELRFDGLDPDDEEVQHKIDTDRVHGATMTPNEYRLRRGEPAIADKNADKYWFVLGREVIPLETADQAQVVAAENPAQEAIDAASSGGSKKPAGNEPSTQTRQQAQKALEAEIDTFDRYLAKARRRRFESDVLPKAVIDVTYAKLAAGMTRRDAMAQLRRSVVEGREMLAASVADALLDRIAPAATG